MYYIYIYISLCKRAGREEFLGAADRRPEGNCAAGEVERRQISGQLGHC